MHSGTYCFIFPLDHPLRCTSDHQRQSIRVIKHQYDYPVVLYHAYQSRKTWRNLFSLRNWQSFWQQLKKAREKHELSFSPLHVLPFERIKLIYELNTHLSFYILFLITLFLFKPKKIVFWLSHPRFYDLVKAPEEILGKKGILFYDCLDYFELLNPKEEQKMRLLENSLLKNADLVVANSHFLAQKHYHLRKDIQVIPSGFRYQDFSSHKNFSPLKIKDEPIILYVGSINYRLDFQLLKELISNNHHWNFQFIGPVYTAQDHGVQDVRSQFKELLSLPNFHHTAYQNPQKLPSLFLGAHIGIIPYDMNVQLNIYCNPLKLLEYFYFGLPVVSTKITALEEIESSFLRKAKTLQDWEHEISYFIHHRPTLSDQKKMRPFALANSWDKRVVAIATQLTCQ